MTDFFEVDEKKQSLMELKLDDLSTAELKIYILELNKEIQRVQSEIKRKEASKKNAHDIFK